MHRIPLPYPTFSTPTLALTAAVVASCSVLPGSRTTGPEGPITRTSASLSLSLVDRPAPTSALLQAVRAVDEEVVWVSGHDGTWLRTEDGGETWFGSRGPGGDSLQFRDVEAIDGATAWLLSAGESAASRIYRTDDGGLSWRLQYAADHPEVFLDCMAVWDPETAVVYGDAVDGRLFVLRTTDAGATWTRLPAGAVPDAQPGEGGFAASGTCAAAGPDDRGWIATGNAERARILTSEDRGRTWTAVEAPVVGGEGAGLTTVAVAEGLGIALGGVIGEAEARGRYVTTSPDGRRWREGGSLALPGAVYGAALVPGFPDVVVAVGPGGLDWSTDGGATWLHADDRAFWAVAFATGGVGWAVGPKGRIVEVRVTR